MRKLTFKVAKQLDFVSKLKKKGQNIPLTFFTSCFFSFKKKWPNNFPFLSDSSFPNASPGHSYTMWREWFPKITTSVHTYFLVSLTPIFQPNLVWPEPCPPPTAFIRFTSIISTNIMIIANTFYVLGTLWNMCRYYPILEMWKLVIETWSSLSGAQGTWQSGARVLGLTPLYGLHIPGGTQNEFLIPANRSEQERGYLFKKLVDIFYGVGNKVASFYCKCAF